MKKLITLFSVLVLSVLMFSCSAGTEGAAGAAGASGTGGLVMYFQNGTAPLISYAGCDDARVRSGTPTNNFGAETIPFFGMDGAEKKRYFIEYDVSALPSNAVIQEVFLSINTSATPGSPEIGFHLVTQSWLEAEVTWNDRIAATPWTTAGGDFNAAAISNYIVVSEDNSLYTWNIDKSVVQGWADTPATNYGIIAVERYELDTGTNHKSFYSSEYGTANLRPKLTVIYTLP